MILAILIVPAFVYGRFLKSIEGRSIGAALGFAVAAVQLIALVAIAIAIFYALEALRHS